MGAAAKPTRTVSSGTRAIAEAKAQEYRTRFASLLGGDIAGRINIVFDATDDSDRDSGQAEARWSNGRYADCTLHLFPATFAENKSALVTLAHEIFHCFQSAAYPSESARAAAPDWLMEGGAEWAAATVVGTDSLDVQLWSLYLRNPGTDLRKRTYDAIGFFAHLEETGHSPWPVFRDMWNSPSDARRFATSGAASADFLDSWASGLSRRATYGKAWDTTGPGITGDSARPTPLSIGLGAAVAVSAKPYTNKLYGLAINTDLVDFRIAGHGRLGDGTVDEPSLGASTYCVRDGGCDCPDGSGPPGPPPLDGDNSLLALTGGPDGTTGTVQGRRLEDVCKPTGTGASYHLDSAAKYSGGPSHVLVDAYTCTSLSGPWQAVLHVTHGPATARDPALDRTVEFTWTFDRNGSAQPTIGPYRDTVFGRTHTIVYYPVLQLNSTLHTITVIRMQGREDGGPKVDVTYQLARAGEAIGLQTGPPKGC